MNLEFKTISLGYTPDDLAAINKALADMMPFDESLYRTVEAHGIKVVIEQVDDEGGAYYYSIGLESVEPRQLQYISFGGALEEFIPIRFAGQNILLQLTAA